MLPNFVCIGAQKTGTTWLYNMLRQHPQVFLPAIKELNFFYRDLPQERYEAHFPAASAQRLRGDISPNYMVLPGVAERMHAVVPGARLICILREPLARAKSQYQMAVKLGNIPADMSFIEAFRANLQYLRERGCYADLLARFEHYYPPERMRVLLYDDLLADPAAFLRDVLSYLGLVQEALPPDHAGKVGAGGDLDLSPEEDAEVRAFYAPTVTQLERHLDRLLSAWRTSRL
jgi:hypothetical protein